MAATYVIHEGQTGTVSNYAVPFDYLSTTHVHVEVNDVPVAFTFISTYMISILPNPIGKVKIFRNTPDEAITTFTDGSVLLGDDLNSAFIQSIYISQEAKDTAFDEMASAIATMEALLDEGETARDLAITKAAEAVASAATALNRQNAAEASAAAAATSEANALASKNTAATKASEAAASAAQAQSLVDSISGGPVTSVNGRSGVVTGLAEQSTTYTKTEVDNALGLKAPQATTYTKTEVDGIVASIAGNVGLVSSYKFENLFK